VDPEDLVGRKELAGDDLQPGGQQAASTIAVANCAPRGLLALQLTVAPVLS
jgi:hypothetical protein